MSEIRAIETVYKGYRFRSRLEARWAVFFDAGKIDWRYEVEGFELPSGERYLPDFWIRHEVKELADQGWGFWAEIKPGPISDEALNKVFQLVYGTKHNALIIQGEPWASGYEVWKVSGRHEAPLRLYRGLYFGVGTFDDSLCELVNNDGETSYPWFHGSFSELQAAYQAARSARFERAG